MFVHQLNTRLRLIMPAMNKIYDSTLYDIDPLLTMSIRTVSARENEGVSTMSRRDDSSSDSTSDSTSNSTSRAVNSQFPQSMLSDDGDYATSAADSTSKTDNTSTGTTTGVSDTKTDAILVLSLSTKSRRMTGIEACHATAFIASIVLMFG